MKITDIVDKEENEKGYIYFILSIANAFAYDEKVRKEIDKLYESNKYLYYKTAKVSGAYDGYLVTMSGITNEIYSKRALGLIISAEDDDVLTGKLIEIIKRNYFDVYISIMSNTEEALMKLINKIEESDLIKPLQKTYEGFIIYLILKLSNNKETLLSIYKVFLNDFITINSAIYLADTNIKEKIKEDREFITGIKNRVFENKGAFYGVEDFYNNPNVEMKKYIKIISNIFQCEKLNATRMLSSIQLSENDLDEIILCYLAEYRDKNLDRCSNVMINGVLIKSIIKAYKEVRETFINNNKETLFLHMEELENKATSLEIENKRLNNELIDSNKRIVGLLENREKDRNDLRKEYEKRFSDLNKKLEELTSQIKIENKKNDELNKLRELFFEIENDHTIIESENTLENLIDGKKILIVGGTADWRKKIKENYTELLVLDGFNENFPISILNNIDYIFFYTGYMNHSTYYRIINYIRSKEIPFGYIGKTNIQLIEQEMIRNLEKGFY